MTSPELGILSEKEKKPIFGLFLFVVNENDEVLMSLNRKTKPSTQKIAGQFTTPAETVERGENLIQDALSRTIKEEVGSILGKIEPKLRGFAAVETNPQLLLACYEINTLQKRVRINPEDTLEVASHHWIPLKDINDQKIPIGNHEVPRFRTPIPEFAENLRKIRAGQKIDAVRRIQPPIPPEVFRNLGFD